MDELGKIEKDIQHARSLASVLAGTARNEQSFDHVRREDIGCVASDICERLENAQTVLGEVSAFLERVTSSLNSSVLN